MKKNGYKSSVGNILNAGVGTLVGVGMMGATSSMVNQLPAGTAKDVAGIIPGLQATTLVAHNLKFVNSSLGNGKGKGKPSSKKPKW